MAPDRLPRRRSLRTNTPARIAKWSQESGSSGGGVSKRARRTRRARAPRTYARKRPRAEVSALEAARSATVSLDTRNCGEARVSLGTAAVPLPALSEDAPDHALSSSDEGGAAPQRRRRAARKRPAARRDDGTDEERDAKLSEFMAQQKAFWDEVDDSNLFEEETT